MAERISKLVLFRGQVQGVGFRRTAYQLAQSFAIGGFVRNQPDGSVLLELEGAAGEVDKFLARLQETMKSKITEMESSAAKPKNRASFEILY